MSVNVASEPSPRRLSVVALLMLLYPPWSPPPATPGFCPPVKFCGMIRETLAKSGRPCSSNPRRVNTMTGDGPLAPRMRVPVTVIGVSRVPSSAVWGPTRTTSAPACSSTIRPLPPMASRTACSTVKVPRTAGDRLPRTSSSTNRISRSPWLAKARSVAARSCAGSSNVTVASCAQAGGINMPAGAAVAASSAVHSAIFEIVILPSHRRLLRR